MGDLRNYPKSAQFYIQEYESLLSQRFNYLKQLTSNLAIVVTSLQQWSTQLSNQVDEVSAIFQSKQQQQLQESQQISQLSQQMLISMLKQSEVLQDGIQQMLQSINEQIAIINTQANEQHTQSTGFFNMINRQFADLTKKQWINETCILFQASLPTVQFNEKIRLQKVQSAIKVIISQVDLLIEKGNVQISNYHKDYLNIKEYLSLNYESSFSSLDTHLMQTITSTISKDSQDNSKQQAYHQIPSELEQYLNEDESQSLEQKEEQLIIQDVDDLIDENLQQSPDSSNGEIAQPKSSSSVLSQSENNLSHCSTTPSKNSSTQSIPSLKKDKSIKYVSLFGVKEGVEPVNNYNCAFSHKILLQGTMYIFYDRIGFHSYFNSQSFVGNTALSIPYKDILKIEKRKNAVVFDNSIAIVTLKGELFFTSYVARDACFTLLSYLISKCNDPNKSEGGLTPQKSVKQSDCQDNEVKDQNEKINLQGVSSFKESEFQENQKDSVLDDQVVDCNRNNHQNEEIELYAKEQNNLESFKEDTTVSSDSSCGSDPSQGYQINTQKAIPRKEKEIDSSLSTQQQSSTTSSSSNLSKSEKKSSLTQDLPSLESTTIILTNLESKTTSQTQQSSITTSNVIPQNSQFKAISSAQLLSSSVSSPVISLKPETFSPSSSQPKEMAEQKDKTLTLPIILQNFQQIEQSLHLQGYALSWPQQRLKQFEQQCLFQQNSSNKQENFSFTFKDVYPRDVFALAFSDAKQFIHQSKTYPHFYYFFSQECLKETDISFSKLNPQAPNWYNNPNSMSYDDMEKHPLISSRQIQCTHPVREKIPFGPKVSQCLTKENYYWISPLMFIIEREVFVSKIPYGDHFSVRQQYKFEYDKQKQQTNFDVKFVVNFIKSTILKSKIESSALSENKDSLQIHFQPQLAKAFPSYLQNKIKEQQQLAIQQQQQLQHQQQQQQKQQQLISLQQQQLEGVSNNENKNHSLIDENKINIKEESSLNQIVCNNNDHSVIGKKSQPGALLFEENKQENIISEQPEESYSEQIYQHKEQQQKIVNQEGPEISGMYLIEKNKMNENESFTKEQLNKLSENNQQISQLTNSLNSLQNTLEKRQRLMSLLMMAISASIILQIFQLIFSNN